MTRAPRACPAPLDSAIVIYDDQPPETLPVRGRSSLPSGRHRRPASADLPPDAPVLVLAVPGERPDVADEIASLTRAARSEGGELDVRVAPLSGSAFADVLRGLPDDRSAVVVPLITGPNPRVYHAIHAGLDEAGVKAMVTDPLGPHPLLAEALHVRLADAGLARADRIRQFSIGAAVDGVIVAAVGGVEAAMEADMTAVLLAARLAVPVVAAALDGQPTVADAVARLRESGGQRIAVAPYVIGPELDHAQLARLASEAGLGCGAPLGAHSSVIRLINLRYEVAMEATMDEGTS
jgi:sirohydrochlorin ferrochelatase